MKPKKHVDLYPNITFDSTIEVQQTFLDKYFYESDLDISDFNMINIDVLGYELEVFKGSVETLNKIDYVIAEVNRDELYENCAKVDEIDNFLSDFGFVRKETNWEGQTWGDAFYLKVNT